MAMDRYGRLVSHLTKSTSPCSGILLNVIDNKPFSGAVSAHNIADSHQLPIATLIVKKRLISNDKIREAYVVKTSEECTFVLNKIKA